MTKLLGKAKMEINLDIVVQLSMLLLVQWHLWSLLVDCKHNLWESRYVASVRSACLCLL